MTNPYITETFVFYKINGGRICMDVNVVSKLKLDCYESTVHKLRKRNH